MNINEYEKSKQIILELLENNLSDIERAKCYTNLIMNAVYTKEYLCIKITIPKLEVLLSLLRDLNIKKFQSYYCLGRAYILLEDRYSAMINFEKELNIGVGDNKNHFFIDQYEYCIEQLVNIYNISEIEKFKKLEKNILAIPKDIFNRDFFIRVSIFFLKVYSHKEFFSFYEKINKKLYEKIEINLKD